MMDRIAFGQSAPSACDKEGDDADRRFVFAGRWQHFFDGRPTWSETRWVFDRAIWSVVFLEILNPITLGWVRGTREEVSSVEFDLTENDSRFLSDLEEWGLSQSQESPDWACMGAELVARAELAEIERLEESGRRNAVRLRLPEGPHVRTVSIRFVGP